MRTRVVSFILRTNVWELKCKLFLYNLQQPTKKIDLAVYTNLLHELKIPPHLVSNTHVKKVLKEVYSDEENKEETEQNSVSEQNSRIRETTKKQTEQLKSKYRLRIKTCTTKKIKPIKRQSRRRKETKCSNY